MVDIVDAVIGEIQAELCRFSQCANVLIDLASTRELSRGQRAIYHTIGGVARSEWKAIPCVSWIEGGGKTDPITATSGDNSTIFNDTIRLRCLVQAESKEAARALWMNLRNASSRTELGRQITWGNYTAPTEERPQKSSCIFAIEADLDLSLAVPLNPQQIPGFPEPLQDYALRPVVSATDQTLDNME